MHDSTKHFASLKHTFNAGEKKQSGRQNTTGRQKERPYEHGVKRITLKIKWTKFAELLFVPRYILVQQIKSLTSSFGRSAELNLQPKLRKEATRHPSMHSPELEKWSHLFFLPRDQTVVQMLPSSRAVYTGHVRWRPLRSNQRTLEHVVTVDDTKPKRRFMWNQVLHNKLRAAKRNEKKKKRPIFLLLILAPLERPI